MSPVVDESGLLETGQAITSINNIRGQTDSSRTAGTYNISSDGFTTNSNGTEATFTIVVDSNGEANITTTSGGKHYKVGHVITIGDSQLGGGGGVPLVFYVASTSAIAYG